MKIQWTVKLTKKKCGNRNRKNKNQISGPTFFLDPIYYFIFLHSLPFDSVSFEVPTTGE